jgi:glycosyltransferase involved in cell wall biosynthesis
MAVLKTEPFFMKIGIIAHLKHPIIAPFAGGLEVFTHHITKELQLRGHEVILFASSGSDPELPLVPILSDENYDTHTGIRIKRRDLPSEYIAEHHAYYQLMITADNYQLDILFNNSLHYIPVTMANIINTPVVTVLHTPPFYEMGLAISAERQTPVIDYVTVSAQNADSWSAYVNDCKVIPNGINMEDWQPYLYPAEEEYAVWFGRIHPDKGLHLAIQAAQQAGVKLKVAGGIADPAYYQAQIVPLLDDSIELIGLQHQRSLNQLIGGARVCLVTPCWQEPFGLVVAEALACGTPVAGFKMGALPDLVSAETGVLVEFGDIDALAAALRTAMKLDRRVISNYAREQFDIKIMIERYEQLLERVAENKLDAKQAIS